MVTTIQSPCTTFYRNRICFESTSLDSFILLYFIHFFFLGGGDCFIDHDFNHYITSLHGKYAVVNSDVQTNFV